MPRSSIRLAATTLFALAIGTSAAHASTRVFVQIGAPVPVVVPAPAPPPPPAVVVAPGPYPRAGYVWRPGHYLWTGYGYQLVPGAWVRPPYPGAVWVAPRWVPGRHGAYWVRGYWRH